MVAYLFCQHYLSEYIMRSVTDLREMVESTPIPAIQSITEIDHTLPTPPHGHSPHVRPLFHVKLQVHEGKIDSNIPHHEISSALDRMYSTIGGLHSINQIECLVMDKMTWDQVCRGWVCV